MVPATGLEPVRCYSLEPESSASSNSATRAGGTINRPAGSYASIRPKSKPILNRSEGLGGLRLVPSSGEAGAQHDSAFAPFRFGEYSSHDRSRALRQE